MVEIDIQSGGSGGLCLKADGPFRSGEGEVLPRLHIDGDVSKTDVAGSGEGLIENDGLQQGFIQCSVRIFWPSDFDSSRARAKRQCAFEIKSKRKGCWHRVSN